MGRVIMFIQRQTSISGNLVQLSRFLRKHGFNIGTRAESDAMEALACLPIHNSQLFRSALKAVFVKSRWQYEHFDDLYDEFWNQLKKAVDSKTKELPEKKDQKVPSKSKRIARIFILVSIYTQGFDCDDF